MANLDMPATWLALKSDEQVVAVCRDCEWRGSRDDWRSQRAQGQQHATEHRGHVVLLAEVVVSVCVAHDVVFTMNPPRR